ncbi:MAG TPA: neocarzinostatin apoprotein domain-containing protein [Mycobacteriales bacterium]|nr:neocarzinostatin apoprotein domain-containing protein [Mycobacteriales bacterium]
MTASATDNLLGGQQITVSGTGFAAGATIGVVECSAPVPSSTNPGADCAIAHAALAQAAADGSFTGALLTLTSGAVGSNGNFCPSKVAGGACYLIAANVADSTNAAEVPLTFAPVITVTPSSNVKSGQKVTVAGFGFPASKLAYVTECASPPSASTCNTVSNVQPMTDANGTLSNVLVTVTTGTWGGKSCNAGASCLITATTDITGTLPDQSTAAPFTFAGSQTTTKVATAIYPTAAVKHGKVSITGAIESAGAGVPAMKLSLYDRAKGTKKWHKVTSGKSAALGVFGFKGLKHLSHAEQYRVTHPDQKVGNTLFKASSSKTLAVK